LISAGAPPQTPLGEFTALHRPLAGFGGHFAAGGGAGPGKRRERGRGGRGSGGERKGA